MLDAAQALQEGSMALWWDRQVRSLILSDIKRTHPPGRLYGVPRPYTWPQPTFLGAVDEDPARADNTRLQRIEQGLNTLLARTATPVAATGTTDTTAATGPFVVVRSTREHAAAVLREEYRPHGIPPRGKGWGKEADKKLRLRGVDISRPEYFRAVGLNKMRLASSLSRETK
jgi:hypothetical protein